MSTATQTPFWITILPYETKHNIIDMVTEAIMHYKSITNNTRRDIGLKFKLNAEKVNELINWVFSDDIQIYLKQEVVISKQKFLKIRKASKFISKHQKDKIKKKLEYENDSYDKILYGYPRKEIIKTINSFLEKIQNVPFRNDKISEVRKLFTFIVKPKCIKFLQDNNRLQNVIRKKLYELYHDESLKEARKWYRMIFKERLPPYVFPKNNDISQEIDSYIQSSIDFARGK